MEDNEWEKSWSEMDPRVRRAIVSSARSSLWWSDLGSKIKGLGPLATAILAILAIIQLFGERLHQWLTSGI